VFGMAERARDWVERWRDTRRAVVLSYRKNFNVSCIEAVFTILTDKSDALGNIERAISFALAGPSQSVTR
jgi:hypothetical protein